jgi:hypothetical protein
MTFITLLAENHVTYVTKTWIVVNTDIRYFYYMRISFIFDDVWAKWFAW